MTPAELEALRGAGAWYAKYHAVRVAEMANDPSAYAEHKREKFLTLVSALRKLGFEMAIPEVLPLQTSATPHQAVSSRASHTTMLGPAQDGAVVASAGARTLGRAEETSCQRAQLALRVAV